MCKQAGQNPIISIKGKEVELLLHMYQLDRNELIARIQQRDQYVIISVSLQSDVAAWKKAVKELGIEREAWLHACDGAGLDSPAAKRFGVEKAPKIVLIEPEGHAVSLDMDIDELGMRIEQILSGDLYYFDQEK